MCVLTEETRPKKREVLRARVWELEDGLATAAITIQGALYDNALCNFYGVHATQDDIDAISTLLAKQLRECGE